MQTLMKQREQRERMDADQSVTKMEEGTAGLKMDDNGGSQQREFEGGFG